MGATANSHPILRRIRASSTFAILHDTVDETTLRSIADRVPGKQEAANCVADGHAERRGVTNCRIERTNLQPRITTAISPTKTIHTKQLQLQLPSGRLEPTPTAFPSQPINHTKMHLLTPSTFLPILLALTSTPITLASPSPNIPDLSNLTSPSFPSQPESLHQNELEDRQVAAGGGIAATTLAPSQYPISTTAGSLFTVNGVTSATWKLFVQTFATTALGPTPAVGSIGLGDIQGTVGVVKNEKRAVETP